MLKERVCISSDQEISGSTRISSVKMYETPAGPRKGAAAPLNPAYSRSRNSSGLKALI